MLDYFQNTVFRISKLLFLENMSTFVLKNSSFIFICCKSYKYHLFYSSSKIESLGVGGQIHFASFVCSFVCLHIHQKLNRTCNRQLYCRKERLGKDEMQEEKLSIKTSRAGFELMTLDSFKHFGGTGLEFISRSRGTGSRQGSVVSELKREQFEEVPRVTLNSSKGVMAAGLSMMCAQLLLECGTE